MRCNLQKISERLISEGLLDKNQTAYCGTYGRNIKLYFPEKKTNHGLFIKCSMDNNIEKECRTLNAVADHFKGYAVQPLRFWREGRFSVAAYPLRQLAVIRPEQFAWPGIEDQLVKLFSLFFSQSRDFQLESIVPDKELISFYEHSHFSFFDALKSCFLGSMHEIRKKYGKTNQHGDFAINNIAVDTRGKLILFDWEDFGRINYPFFDLATLAFSNVLSQDKVEELGEDPGILSDFPGADMVALVCRQQGMSINSFKKHFPFYMMLFIYLKQDLAYGDYIIARLKKFLDRASNSKKWASYLH